MYYAQLNHGVVVAITESPGQITAPDVVQIASFDTSLIGCTYVDGVFVPLPVVQTGPDWAWFIDHGPFADRLGATATMTIDVSADPGFVAIRADFARRKWIDLKDPRVAATVNYLAGQPLPVLGALATPLITPERAAQILAAKPELTENLALRKLYFNA